VPHRGKRCEPSMVRLTAEAAAQLRHSSVGELTELTGATAQAFFQKRRC
jgi:Tat protein secretion system quality control protein TatD with DNase activity